MLEEKGCSLNLPSSLHELDEVVVVVDVGGDGSVVVVPLFLCDDAVTVLVAEAGQELHEDLLFSHFARLDLWVLARVVDDAQVARVDNTVAILIELLESLVNDGHTGGVRCSTDSVEELVEADDAVLVGVEVAEQDLGLVLGDVGAHVLKAPVELLHLNLAIAIVVHDSESTAHATDGANTTRLQGGLHLLEN